MGTGILELNGMEIGDGTDIVEIIGMETRDVHSNVEFICDGDTRWAQILWS